MRSEPATEVLTREESGTALLRIRGMTKRYGPATVLTEVDLDVEAGEVHALIGHNGAGKSTLIKCLAGAVKPDAGTIEVGAATLAPGDPAAARLAGVQVVYQELSLFGRLTVAENLAGVTTAAGLTMSWSQTYRKAREMLAQAGLGVDPRKRVEELPIGQQQMVEIVRAMNSGARIIVLDEPSSALSPGEIRTLFSFVHRLAERGVGFILITHFLSEVQQHAHRVTVLRAGRRVASLPVAETTPRQLVELSVGADRAAASTYTDIARDLPERSAAPLVVRAEEIWAPPSVRGVSFELHAGEVLGIYGELGAGHSELAEILFGRRHVVRGSLNVLGYRGRRPSSEAMRELGVAYIPADRRAALAATKPVAANTTLAALHRLTGPWLRSRPELAKTRDLIGHLGIRGARPETAVAGLSGGNQQKVLLARWLVHPPKLLVLDEPTRGMDVGAKTEVLGIVERLAAQGAAVLLVSTEPETVLAAADRILIARRGHLVAEFHGRKVTNHDLMEAAA